jgi:hypothetical protein
LRAALSQEVRAATAELDGAQEHPKAIHRCRVHLKRARALARIGSASAPGLAQVFNDSARAVMRGLAPARDLTAFTEAARLTAASARRKARIALDYVANGLETLRLGARGPDLEAVRAGLRDLIALANVWPETSARQIRAGAKRLVRRARRARKHGLAADCPSLRHEWRKCEKDRYFAALILDDAWPNKRRRKIGERLGDVLGQERDVLLLIDRLKSDPSLAGKRKNLKRALRALNAHRRRLASSSDTLGARLHAGGA